MLIVKLLGIFTAERNQQLKGIEGSWKSVELINCMIDPHFNKWKNFYSILT